MCLTGSLDFAAFGGEEGEIFPRNIEMMLGELARGSRRRDRPER